MRRFSVRLLIALFTFCIGVAAAVGWFVSRTPDAVITATRPAPLTPADANNPSPPGWGRTFYPYIDKHTGPAGLAALRSAPLPEEDLEVRVWFGFGLTPLEGFILRRTGGRWSALHLEGDDYYEPKKVKSKKLPPPTSGWESFWGRLDAAGIRTLPDSSEIDDDAGGPDGWAYLVELREGSSYRAFHYQLPEYSRRAEAVLVLEMGNAIGEEFELPSFKQKDVAGRRTRPGGDLRRWSGRRDGERAVKARECRV